MAKQKNNDWVPVNVTLPAECGYYLTCSNKGDVYIDYWDGLEFDQWDDVGHEERLKRIVAWMPLPEPYKEGRLKDGKA